MASANTGAAIIEGVLVPRTEMKVLLKLKELDREVAVPEIAAALKNELSDASIYTLLGRLAKRGRLVDRRDVVVNVHGTKLRRVLWSAHPTDPASRAKEIRGKSLETASQSSERSEATV